MTSSLAPQPAYLLSIVKPIIMFLVLAGWAWAVNFFDKDLKRNYLAWKLWNPIQLAGGALAFGLWLLIPYFYVGLVLALLILGGTLFAYVWHRNTKVPPKLKWDFSLESFQRRMDQRELAAAQTQATFKLLNPDNSPMEVPAGEDPAAKAHELLEQAVVFVLLRGGDRIELSVSAQQARLSGLVDGVRYDMPQIDTRLAMTLINYLKGRTGMDLEDRRKKQSAVVGVQTAEHGRHNLGLVTYGSTRELVMQVTIDPQKRTVMPLEKLGLLGQQYEQLTSLFETKGRLVLLACPPHNGQTTTLYSLVARHDPYTQSVMTLEENKAVDLEGVTHQAIDPGADAPTIARLIASVVRKGPDVVMLERVTDPQVARAVAEAAQTVRLYTCLQQNDTFSALKVWAKAVGDLKLAAAGLQAIVSQRLLRKLCVTCRVPYQPDPEGLRKMNLPADKVTQLYKHSGQVMVRNKPETCPDCQGLGYRGRTGVFEVMVLDDQARQLLAQGQLDPLRAHLRKHKMLYLQEAALSRVVEGVTSISEVTRALAGK